MTHKKPLEPLSLCNSPAEIQYVGVLSTAVMKPFQRPNLNAAQFPRRSGATQQQPAMNDYPLQPRPLETQGASGSLPTFLAHCQEHEPCEPRPSPLQTAAVCAVARLWEAGVIRANSAKLNCSFVHHYHKIFM